MDLKTLIPSILIIAFLMLAWIGFNRLIESQAENRVIYERLREDNKELMQLHAKQLKVLDSLKMDGKQRDSLINKYDEKLKYIEKQNNVIYDRYNNLPALQLPEL